ncbi:MAG: ABC transporter ATP-binding protein [Acidobacteriota bacterium]
MTTASVDAFDAVTIDRVSKHYGRRRALWRVSLTCRAGTITGLFGPNGAGKSTLLNLLSTLGRPSDGTIHYGDATADAWGDALRGHIGVLGHDLFLYGDLSARENLAFFARLYGVRHIESAVNRGLASARLSERAEDRASAFSRGLRQRLALERALVHSPRLVLLDEPFTGLDDASAVLLVDRLRQIKNAGAIIVMATHDFDLADGLVDQPVCLSGGRMASMPADGGSLRERYRRAVQAGAR